MISPMYNAESSGYHHTFLQIQVQTLIILSLFSDTHLQSTDKLKRRTKIRPHPPISETDLKFYQQSLKKLEAVAKEDDQNHILETDDYNYNDFDTFESSEYQNFQFRKMKTKHSKSTKQKSKTSNVKKSPSKHSKKSRDKKSRSKKSKTKAPEHYDKISSKRTGDDGVEKHGNESPKMQSSIEKYDPGDSVEQDEEDEPFIPPSYPDEQIVESVKREEVKRVVQVIYQGAPYPFLLNPTESTRWTLSNCNMDPDGLLKHVEGDSKYFINRDPNSLIASFGESARIMDVIHGCVSLGLQSVEIRHWDDYASLVRQYYRGSLIDQTLRMTMSMRSDVLGTPGDWGYPNGERLTFSYWMSNEPNNFTRETAPEGESCAYLKWRPKLEGGPNEVDWEDYPCNLNIKDWNFFQACQFPKGHPCYESSSEERAWRERDKGLFLVGEVGSRKYYSSFEQKNTFQDAFEFCKASGYHLWQIPPYETRNEFLVIHKELLKKFEVKLHARFWSSAYISNPAENHKEWIWRQLNKNETYDRHVREMAWWDSFPQCEPCERTTGQSPYDNCISWSASEPKAVPDWLFNLRAFTCNQPFFVYCISDPALENEPESETTAPPEAEFETTTTNSADQSEYAITTDSNGQSGEESTTESDETTTIDPDGQNGEESTTNSSGQSGEETTTDPDGQNGEESTTYSSGQSGEETTTDPDGQNGEESTTYSSGEETTTDPDGHSGETSTTDQADKIGETSVSDDDNSDREGKDPITNEFWQWSLIAV